ncbi:anti-sigma factor [Sphingobium sufflavum]|uniref:anti-sigma factor n=1 Tax=Sphingobium sufflavum TaxID=1129547 RepID=UPI001F240FD1|nr:anti-sigma factor [Sphingobium sufflavum]MCE7796736.1 anti-sigma factor [Sphingobium sufflavum]
MVDGPLPPDRADLAAELALGLLEGSERAEALRLCLSDPGFAAEVEAWGHRLSPLLDATPLEWPSHRVWNAVEVRIADRPSSGQIRSLRLWRGGAIAAGVMAASLALVLILPRPASQAPETVGVSQLADAQGSATMAISYDPQAGVLRLGPNSLQGGTKSPELWVIPEDGVPRSLGLIGADGGRLAVEGRLRQFLRNGVTLAITLEDPATAPHKAPTSTPILTGKISII